jgi:hypothetical protein
VSYSRRRFVDEVKLKKEWSTDKEWFKYVDSRPPHVRKAFGSKTVVDRWFYGPNEDLELRFETTPERGFGIWFRDKRIGFSAEISPEPELGDSIRAAKKKAVELLSDATGTGTGKPSR